MIATRDIRHSEDGPWRTGIDWGWSWRIWMSSSKENELKFADGMENVIFSSKSDIFETWKIFETSLALSNAQKALQCRLNQIGQSPIHFAFCVSGYDVLCAVSIDAYHINFTFLRTFHAFLWLSHLIYSKRKYALLLLISSHFILRDAFEKIMTRLSEPCFRSYWFTHAVFNANVFTIMTLIWTC